MRSSPGAILVGVSALAIGACSTELSRPPVADVCKFVAKADERSLYRDGRYPATTILLQHADEETPVQVRVNGQTVLNQPLPPDFDGTGTSGYLVCSITGQSRLDVTIGDRTFSETFVIQSDDEKVLVELGRGSVEVVEGPLLLD